MRILATLVTLVALCTPNAHATVFGLTRFVVGDQFLIGIEPEVVLVPNNTSVGFNARFMKGQGDLLNWGFQAGAGSGGRGFRVGGLATLDFFPDIEGQVGIGLGTLLQYQARTLGSWIGFEAIPYIHKKISNKKNEFEPFFAFPLGPALDNGALVMSATAVVGSLFEVTTQLKFSVELGIGVANSATYVSGGLIYYAN